jgi:hypothetical protein
MSDYPGREISRYSGPQPSAAITHAHYLISLSYLSLRASGASHSPIPPSHHPLGCGGAWAACWGPIPPAHWWATGGLWWKYFTARHSVLHFLDRGQQFRHQQVLGIDGGISPLLPYGYSHRIREKILRTPPAIHRMSFLA